MRKGLPLPLPPPRDHGPPLFKVIWMDHGFQKRANRVGGPSKMGLRPLLGASWNQHGPQTFQLGDKMTPRPPTWGQDGSQTPQNRVPWKGSWISKTCKSRGRSFKNGSWARLGRFLEPTWPPDLPTWRQDDSQTSDLGPRWLPDPSTWTQDGLQAPQLGAIK